jgi:hypothetical protein
VCTRVVLVALVVIALLALTLLLPPTDRLRFLLSVVRLRAEGWPNAAGPLKGSADRPEPDQRPQSTALRWNSQPQGVPTARKPTSTHIVRTKDPDEMCCSDGVS